MLEDASHTFQLGTFDINSLNLIFMNISIP